MSNNTPDDANRFLRAVAAFSAAPEPTTKYGRKIASTAETVLSAMLTEVNETVLRRALHLTVSDGAALKLDVAERRIHRVISVPDVLQGEHADILSRPLVAKDAGALLSMLKACAAGSDALFARTSLPDTSDKNGFEGLSVTELRDLLAQTDQGDAPLTDLFASLQPNAIAIFARQGTDTPLTQGTQPDIEVLARMTTTLVTESGDSATVTLLHGDWQDDATVLMAAFGADRLAAVLPFSVALARFSDLALRCEVHAT